VIILLDRDTRCHLTPSQGTVVGALLNMPLNDKLGLGKVTRFFNTRIKLICYSPDARGRASLPDRSVYYPIS
jgi:hypothetical protein